LEHFKESGLQKNVVIAVLLVILAIVLLWPGQDKHTDKGRGSLKTPSPNTARPDPWIRQRQLGQPPYQDAWHGPPQDGVYPYIGSNPSAPYGGRYDPPGQYGMPGFRLDPSEGQSFYSQSPYAPDAGRYQYPYVPGYHFRPPSKTESPDRYSEGHPEDRRPPVSTPMSDWSYSPYPQGPSQYPNQDYRDPSTYAPSSDRYSGH